MRRHVSSGSLSETTRWLSIVLCLAGGIAAFTVVVLILSDERVAHVFSSIRWMAIAAALTSCALSVGWAVVEWTRPAVHRSPARIWRDLFLLCVAAVVLQVVFSNNFKPSLCALSFAGASACFAAMRWSERVWAGWRDRQLTRALERTAFQVALVLVLLESSLRLLGFVWPNPMFARDESGVEEAMAMYRTEPGGVRYGFPCNSRGHYDVEFAPGSRTVVSIGDSFSVGVVPHAYHFTTVCERELPGVAVHNLGRAGIGPGGYLWFLRNEALRLGPDLVLINLFLGNDLAEAGRWNQGGGVLRSVCDRRNVLTFQVPLRIARLMRERSQTGVRGAPFTAGAEFGERIDDPGVLRSKMPWLEDPMLENPTMSPEQFHRIEAERASHIHNGNRNGSYEKLYSVLDEILATAGTVRTVFMLIPDQFQVDEEVWHEVLQRTRGVQLDRDQPQKQVAAWLRARGVPFLDLLPILRAVPTASDGRRHLYHLRDTHFNAHGNRIAGKALAGFLRTQLR